jgi:hypothetical protein
VIQKAAHRAAFSNMRAYGEEIMDHRITDREFYPAIWITIVALVLGYGIWRYALDMPTISSCWVWGNWQVYCPGCGGTRSLLALIQGDILRSFYYHPALPVLVIVLSIYLISQTVWRLRKKQGWVLHYRSSWVPCMLAILILNCLIRNILWLGFGIAIT